MDVFGTADLRHDDEVDPTLRALDHLDQIADEPGGIERVHAEGARPPSPVPLPQRLGHG